MDSIQISKIAYDSIQAAIKYDLALSQSQDQAKFYLWVLGIAGTVIIGLISFIAYSWNGRLVDLTGAIKDLSRNLMKTTQKFEVSLAEEVAHRGYCIEKHQQHAADIKILRADVDDVTGRVDLIEADHRRIHVGNSTI